MLNYLPIIGQAIQFVAEILFNGFSDYFGVRLPFLLLHAVCLIVDFASSHLYLFLSNLCMAGHQYRLTHHSDHPTC